MKKIVLILLIIMGTMIFSLGPVQASGESSTPPNGVFLNGSYYEELVFFNRAPALDWMDHNAYNLSTSTGNTFNLSLLEVNPIQFTLTEGAKFIASFIALDMNPDTIEIAGYDISISVVSGEVLIWNGDDVETYEEFSFLASGFVEFYFLVLEDPIYYTVTFNVNGGSVVEAQEVAEGEYAVQPATPTKTGYTFSGWYTNQIMTIGFVFTEVQINENITLYAKWVPISSGTPITPEAGPISPILIYGGLALVIGAILIFNSKRKKKRR